MMQVVDGFVRDQTVLLTYFTYVQENIRLDVQSAKHQIINNVIVKELRGMLEEMLLTNGKESRKNRSERTKRGTQRGERNLIEELERIQNENTVIEEIGAEIIDKEVREELLEIGLQNERESKVVQGFEDTAVSSLMDLIITEMAIKEVEKDKELKTESEAIFDNMLKREFKEDLILTAFENEIGEQIQKEIFKNSLSKLEFDTHLQILASSIIDKVLYIETKNVIDQEIQIQSFCTTFIDKSVKKELAHTAKQTLNLNRVNGLLIQEYQHDLLNFLVSSQIQVMALNLYQESEAQQQVTEGMIEGTLERETLKAINDSLGYIHEINQLAYDVAFHILQETTFKTTTQVMSETISECQVSQNILDETLQREILTTSKEVKMEKLATKSVDLCQNAIQGDLIDQALTKEMQEEELAEDVFNLLLEKLLFTDLTDMEVEERMNSKCQNFETNESSAVNYHQQELIEVIFDEITIQNICAVIIESISTFVPEENFTQIDEKKFTSRKLLRHSKLWLEHNHISQEKSGYRLTV